MRIAQIGPRIDDESSGVGLAVRMLCDEMVKRGNAVELHLIEPVHECVRNGKYSVHSYHPWPVAGKFGFAPKAMSGLRAACGRSDILHSNSLWLYVNQIPATAIQHTNCKLIISSHGMLSSWALARSSIFKKVLWGVGQHKTLLRAACLHATSQFEYREIRNVGLRSPVAVIPYGVEMPPEIQWSQDGKLRRLLFLSRIHPKKGVDALLKCWSILQSKHADWELAIVGPDDGGYRDQYKSLASSSGLQRVSFHDAVHGKEKIERFSSSELYVLPTHSENFAFTVAESLSCGVPVITTTGAPWQGLVEHRCGWWIDMSVEALTDCLDKAMRLSSEELRDMGARGRQWMQRDFAWPTVAGKMLTTYEWVLHGGNRPEWIQID